MSSSRRPRAQRSTASPLPSPGTTLDFLRLLWALDHALQKRSKRMATERGVTGPQRFALRVIEQQAGISAGRLAERLKIHPSTLTGIISRLERDGLIQRRNATGDLRRAELAITPAGTAKIQHSSVGSVERSVAAVLGRTSDDDLNTIVRFLQALEVALDHDS